MSRFVRVTHIRTEQPAWINLDLVQCMKPMRPSPATTYSPDLPERTLLVFGPPTDGDPFSNSVEVVETPEEILALADPENPCPDGQACGYFSHYLAYGGPDLTHAGWHAAEKLAAQHMDTCRLMERTGKCSACTGWETRLRA